MRQASFFSFLLDGCNLHGINLLCYAITYFFLLFMFLIYITIQYYTIAICICAEALLIARVLYFMQKRCGIAGNDFFKHG